MSEPKRETDPSGREILVYDNGARKWADNGHWLNGPTDPEFNPVRKDPRGMLARRNELSKQIAREAIDEGAGFDPSQWGTGEGWRRVIVHTVQTYLQSKNIRGMGEVLSKLGIAAGYMSSKEGEATAPEHGISATPQAIRELLTLLDEELQARLEKSQAIDGEEA